MGVSNVPFGDLSLSDEPSNDRVAAFLFSNSILLPLSAFLVKSLCNSNKKKK
uniref:Uncharacterized protein n=1 Tax=Rhizophora mucronata TaxID=61149 RepID=A0A2P2LDI1_RHIMU